MHAIEKLANAAKGAFEPGTAETSEWLAVQRHALRQGDAGWVLAALAALPPSTRRDTAIHYLTVRRAMLDYARCDAEEWQVGSGAVESANTLIVEARLKGAGMHWSRAQVTPMVALRALDASDRRATAWPRIVTVWRAGHRRAASIRRAARAAPAAPPPESSATPPPPERAKISIMMETSRCAEVPFVRTHGIRRIALPVRAVWRLQPDQQPGTKVGHRSASWAGVRSIDW